LSKKKIKRVRDELLAVFGSLVVPNRETLRYDGMGYVEIMKFEIVTTRIPPKSLKNFKETNERILWTGQYSHHLPRRSGDLKLELRNQKMAISEDYQGQTFVVFTDISGFKAMMKSEARLMSAMDALYSSGYNNLRDQNQQPRVEGLFVSDCGILFARRNQESELLALSAILRILAAVHREVFESTFSLTTSIAFGAFAYRGKIEFEGVERNAIHGDAYLAAYLDSINKRPKLYPSECRILTRGLPDFVNADSIQTMPIAHRRIREEGQHIYFDWMKRQQNQH
jgi:hypothetical protein